MGLDLQPGGLTAGFFHQLVFERTSLQSLLHLHWLQLPALYGNCLQVYKFKFDLQPGSLTDQVAGEHQPSYKHP